jgi:hypothetical protein
VARQRSTDRVRTVVPILALAGGADADKAVQ